MTNEQKYKQLTQIFGAYSLRLESLYDKFIERLAVLAHKSGVTEEELLEKNALFRFGNFPELRKELNDIFADYVQNDMLAYKAGITDGVALAYSHDALVLSGVSILSDKAITAARNTAAATFIRNRLKPATGLGLSQLVWNYASQSKSEFDMALSNVIADGLKKGTSAAELSLKVRQYLNNPDMMYRRYHHVIVDKGGNKKDVVKWRRKVIDENGKVRFVEAPLEEVGMGHYRSSRKNADRLMRTEINASYHRANAERWQLEPFVIGIMIELSPQHPEYDMCDELQGRYPKDFIYTGWHPQCLCMSNPITIQGEEKKQFYKRLAAGEDMSGYVSPNAVKEIPDKAKAWINANREQFISAGERGKLGWVWRDNMKYISKEFTKDELLKMGYAPKNTKRIKTAEEKAAIQERWNERKLANMAVSDGKKMMENLKDYPHLLEEAKALSSAIETRDRYGVITALDAMRPRLAFERSITPDMLRDSVMRKKYGDEAVDALYANVKRTINSKVSGSIDEKIKTLRFEADWVVKNRSFATVKEVAAYYEREAVRLEAMKKFDEVRNEILEVERKLSRYGVKTSLTGREWYGDIDTLEKKLKGLEGYKTKFERIDKIEQGTRVFKSTDLKAYYDSMKLSLDMYGADANIEEVLTKAEKKLHQLEVDKAWRERKAAEKAAEERRKKMEELLGKSITVDDYKKILGNKFPKSLENLQMEVDKYVKAQQIPQDKATEAILKIKEVIASSDLGMNVPRVDSRGNEVLEKLFSSHFKSQIETGTGNGMVNVSSRKMATKSLFGSPIDKMAPKEFEKYGFLMDKDIVAQSHSGIADNYWNYRDGVQIRFKRDRVVATFTTCDSLGSGLKPSLITDPQTSSFSSIDRILRASTKPTSTIEATRKYASSYIELQYHGDLTLDCIESIFIPEEVLPKLSSKVMELMRKTGATLYSEKEGKLITL